MNLHLIILGFLLIVSLIDLKYKQVPSILMTAGIFMFAIINLTNFPFALILTILGVLLLESGFYDGIADLKSCSIIGFMMESYSDIFLFIPILLLMGIIYKIIAKYLVKQRFEVPYLPVFFISYLLYYLVIVM